MKPRVCKEAADVIYHGIVLASAKMMNRNLEPNAIFMPGSCHLSFYHTRTA